MKIQLKTARVLSAERVPKSEKLIKLQVSLGTEQRQIVAGIGKKYEPDMLVGKTIVIVANLKPAKLMGIESQGMVLAAGDTDVRGLLTIQEEVDPGTKVK
jgi:methionyl-tRNA synthetase